LIEISQTKSFL